MREIIKKYLYPNCLILKAYRISYWYIIKKIRREPKFWQFDILNAYATYKTKIKFVQIGSNNGINGDPICNYIKSMEWQGILVEPVPHLFEELKQNYHGFENCLIFENIAVSKNKGVSKFYRLRLQPDQPQWYSQIGTFNKEVILSHRDKIPFFDELLMEDTVNAITFNDLLEKHSIEKIDLIHIDTEGYDFEILKLIPFQKFSIEIIMFEHMHLAPTCYKLAQKLLEQHGYILGRTNNMDTVAVKSHILKYLVQGKLN